MFPHIDNQTPIKARKPRRSLISCILLRSYSLFKQQCNWIKWEKSSKCGWVQAVTKSNREVRSLRWASVIQRGADVAFMQLSDTSSQLNCPAAFTQLTPGHRVTGKVFVWKQAKERIYISDIFSAPPASLPLHTDLFLFVSLLRIPDKYYVPEKATSKVGDMQKAFHDNCRV